MKKEKSFIAMKLKKGSRHSSRIGLILRRKRNEETERAVTQTKRIGRLNANVKCYYFHYIVFVQPLNGRVK